MTISVGFKPPLPDDNRVMASHKHVHNNVLEVRTSHKHVLKSAGIQDIDRKWMWKLLN